MKAVGLASMFSSKPDPHAALEAHVNPMDYEEHDDIVADMLESPQWTNGNAGILRAGRPLFATLTRPENTFWVCPHYSINEQQAFDIFYAFLALRSLYYDQHPELGRPLNAGLDLMRLASMREGQEGEPTSVFAVAAVARAIKKFKEHGHRARYRRGYRSNGDEKAVINEEDVRRVATFICEPDAIEVMTERFMQEFDPQNTGVVTLRTFLDYLETECTKRELTTTERFFYMFDEPLSSRMSFILTMLVMLLIVISSLGFILSTEPTFQVSGKRATEGSLGDSVNDDDDLSNPPEPLPIFFDIEAICIFIFTLEYLARVCTVWAVREELRASKIKIPILDAKMPSLSPEEEAQLKEERWLKQAEARKLKLEQEQEKERAKLESLQDEDGKSYDFSAKSSSPRFATPPRNSDTSPKLGYRKSSSPVIGRTSPTDSLNGEEKNGGSIDEYGKRRSRASKRLTSFLSGGVSNVSNEYSVVSSTIPTKKVWKLDTSANSGPGAPRRPVLLDDEFGGLGAGSHKQESSGAGFMRTYNYVFAPMNLIDAIAIVPFYISLVMGSGSGLAVLRILRLARVFRIFKVGKYNEGITMLSNTLKKSLPALQLMGFFSTIAIILFGSLIYFAENGEWHKPYSCVDIADFDCDEGGYLRPTVTGRGKEPTPFSSIPRSFWFIAVTSTTVGYGDMVPTTPAGKVISTCTMVAAILVLALPITIIGTNFSEEYDHIQERKNRETREREKEKRRIEETKNAAISNEEHPDLSDSDSYSDDSDHEREVAAMAPFLNSLPSNGSNGLATFQGNVNWISADKKLLTPDKLSKMSRNPREHKLEGMESPDLSLEVDTQAVSTLSSPKSEGGLEKMVTFAPINSLDDANDNSIDLPQNKLIMGSGGSSIDQALTGSPKSLRAIHLPPIIQSPSSPLLSSSPSSPSSPNDASGAKTLPDNTLSLSNDALLKPNSSEEEHRHSHHHHHHHHHHHQQQQYQERQKSLPLSNRIESGGESSSPSNSSTNSKSKVISSRTFSGESFGDSASGGRRRRFKKRNTLAQKDPVLLALVSKSLRDAAGGAYDRALHRRNRGRRLEASNRKRRAMQMAGIASRFQPTDTDSLIEKRREIEDEIENEENESLDEEEAGNSLASVNVHAPNEPKFLFNARASVRTFCGVDLVPERVPLVPHGIHPRRRHGGGQGPAVGFMSVTPDERIDEHLDVAIEKAQRFLDYILVLSSKEKIGEASSINIAREVQSLLRKIALQYEASHMQENGLDFKSDLELGPAVDTAVALILVWARRHSSHSHHHHSNQSASSNKPPAPNMTKGGKKKTIKGMPAPKGEDSTATMHIEEERQLRFCAISFALAASKASEELQKKQAKERGNIDI